MKFFSNAQAIRVEGVRRRTSGTGPDGTIVSGSTLFQIPDPASIRATTFGPRSRLENLHDDMPVGCFLEIFPSIILIPLELKVLSGKNAFVITVSETELEPDEAN